VSRLTPRQARFVGEYIIDLDPAAAYVRAGYQARGNVAKSNANRLLTNADIQAAIAEQMKAREARTQITQDRVLRELARIGFFDIRKLVAEDAAPLPLSDLDDDTAAALAGLEVVTIGNQDRGVGQILKYKIADKNRALEMIARHLGMFIDRKEITGANGGPVVLQVGNQVLSARELGWTE